MSPVELELSPSSRGGPDSDSGLSTLALVNALLRRRLLVAGMPLLAVAVLAAVTLPLPRKYVSSTAFMPQGPDTRSRMAGLAAQFGIAIPSAEPGQSPAFYVELIQSREVLLSLLQSRYAFTVNGERHAGTLVELLKSRGNDSARRVEDGLERLRRALDPARSRETNIVNVSVETKWPPLSQEILVRLLKKLNDFNLSTRRTQAANERAFVERRLDEAASELRVAEERLRQFQRENRQYASSPDLTLEYERLQRQVSLRQQLYTTLAQSFEQARIDEVRDTPVLTIIAEPNLPALPASRRLLVKSVLAAAAGLVLAVLIVVADVLVKPHEPNLESDLEEFRALRRDAFADLRNPFRPIGRALRGRRAAS